MAEVRRKYDPEFWEELEGDRPTMKPFGVATLDELAPSRMTELRHLGR